MHDANRNCGLTAAATFFINSHPCETSHRRGDSMTDDRVVRPASWLNVATASFVIHVRCRTAFFSAQYTTSAAVITCSEYLYCTPGDEYLFIGAAQQITAEVKKYYIANGEVQFTGCRENIAIFKTAMHNPTSKRWYRKTLWYNSSKNLSELWCIYFLIFSHKQI